jgi:hypothetical protein
LQHVIEPELSVSEEANKNNQLIIVAETETFIETLSVSKTVMRMDLSSEHALLFRNNKSGGMNFAYVSSDGNIGWIDPSVDDGGPAS